MTLVLMTQFGVHRTYPPNGVSMSHPLSQPNTSFTLADNVVDPSGLNQNSGTLQGPSLSVMTLEPQVLA